MKQRIMRISLDCSKVGNQLCIDGIRQGDTNSIVLLISLTNGTEPMDIIGGYPDESIVVTMYGKKSDGTTLVRHCSINEDGNILYQINTQDTTSVGIVSYQLVIATTYNRVLASPVFSAMVEERNLLRTYTVLLSEPYDWADNFDHYYRYENGNFIKLSRHEGVTGDAPEWVINKYYSATNDDAESTSDFDALTFALLNAQSYADRAEEYLEEVKKKADKATTLDGYGITDALQNANGTVTTNNLANDCVSSNKLSADVRASLNSKAESAKVNQQLSLKADASSVYTKSESDALLADKANSADVDASVKTINTTIANNQKSVNASFESLNAALAKKADKNAVDTSLASKANLVNSLNIFDFDVWAKELQGLTTPVYNGTLDKVDYNEKSITFTGTEARSHTNGWLSSAPKSMRIAVKPNTKINISWLPSSTNSGVYVFLNGVNASTTRFLLKSGFGSFTTAEDTTYILIRFDYYGVGFFKVSEIMIAERESIYLPNKVSEGVPEVADEVWVFEKTTQASLDSKYDSSNIETGKGELTPAQAIYDGFEGSFNYSKIGKTVTVALNITTLVAGKNYVQFAGLPFKTMTASKLSSIAVYTTANKLVNLRFDGTWLYVSSPGTTFADGEKINAIITYIIG